MTIVQVLFLQQSPTPCKLKAHIIILYFAQKVEYQMKNIITRVSWVKDVNDLILPRTCSITFASLVNFIRSSSGITLQPELGLFAFSYLFADRNPPSLTVSLTVKYTFFYDSPYSYICEVCCVRVHLPGQLYSSLEGR